MNTVRTRITRLTAPHLLTNINHFLVRIGLAAAMAMGLLAATVATAPAASASGCPNVLTPVAGFGSPVYGAQITVNISAYNPPDSNLGGVGLHVVYEDSIGRTRGYTWAHSRPVHETVRLPGDGRGVANVVRIWLQVIGDPRLLDCSFSVAASDALPTLDRLCYERSGIGATPLEFNFDTPTGAVEAKVAFAARPGAGVSVQTWMTNSIESRLKVADHHFAPWQEHEPQTVVLPKDGRGVYNVIKAEFKMEAPGWYDVLKCTPEVTAGGAVSDIESRCFAGQTLEFVSPDPTGPVQGQVTVKARASRANLVVVGRAYRNDGTESGYSKYVDIPDPTDPPNPGLPETTIILPEHGNGVANVARFTLEVDLTTWPNLLACAPAVVMVTSP